MPLVLFTLAIFQIRSLFFDQASLDCNSPIYALHVAGMTGTYHHAQLIIEMGYCELFAKSGLKPQSSQSLPPKLLGL
jgi:hypothetical protein